MQALWVRRHTFGSCRVLNFPATTRPFCVALSPSVDWHVRPLHCSAVSFILLSCLCALYNCFFLNFVSGNLALAGFYSCYEHPTSTVLEHLESGPGPWLGHMCRPGAWVDDSDCRALEQKSQKVLGHYFPWIVENNWKPWPTLKVFKTSPPRLQNATPSGQKEIPSRQLERNVGKGFIFEGKNLIIVKPVRCCVYSAAWELLHQCCSMRAAKKCCLVRAAA